MGLITVLSAIVMLFTLKTHAGSVISPQTEQAVLELTTQAIPKLRPTGGGEIFIPHPPVVERFPTEPRPVPGLRAPVPLWDAGYPPWFAERVQHLFDCYNCQESQADQEACQAVIFEILNPHSRVNVTLEIRSKMERVRESLKRKTCLDTKEVLVSDVPVVDMPIVPVIVPNLHPVPEPSGFGILGVGVAFILFYLL